MPFSNDISYAVSQTLMVTKLIISLCVFDIMRFMMFGCSLADSYLSGIRAISVSLLTGLSTLQFFCIH